MIAVVTLVNGANTYINTKFSSYGADVFTVSTRPQFILNAEDYVKYQKRKNVVLADYRTIEAGCRKCTGIGAQQATVAKVVHGTQSVTGLVDTRVYVADGFAAEFGDCEWAGLYRERRGTCFACLPDRVGYSG